MGEVKVATVEVDNMATLPVGRPHSSDLTPERNNVTNKEMELKKKPKDLHHHKSQQQGQQEEPKR